MSLGPTLNGKSVCTKTVQQKEKKVMSPSKEEHIMAIEQNATEASSKP